MLFGLMKLLPDGKKAEWYNVTKLRKKHPAWFREDLSKLFALFDGPGYLQRIIGAKFPLKDAALANAMLEKGETSGKIVLLPA